MNPKVQGNVVFRSPYEYIYKLKLTASLFRNNLQTEEELGLCWLIAIVLTYLLVLCTTLCKNVVLLEGLVTLSFLMQNPSSR